jgi:hypothetical protein
LVPGRLAPHSIHLALEQRCRGEIALGNSLGDLLLQDFGSSCVNACLDICSEKESLLSYRTGKLKLQGTHAS